MDTSYGPMDNQAVFVREGGRRLARGNTIANELFNSMKWEAKVLGDSCLKSLELNPAEYQQKLEGARQEMASWNLKLGQTLAYTPEEWMKAKITREAANQYIASEQHRLIYANALHQAIVAEAIRMGGLAEILIEEGKKGNLLTVIETSSRLAPVLTFPGASSYLCAMVVPYAREARTVLGEDHEGRKHFISEEAVRESADNAYNLFGAKMVLAESSAAPRSDVPKSGRKPEVYIARMLPNEPSSNVTHHVIDTPFREEFDARVRELMFFALKEMYK